LAEKIEYILEQRQKQVEGNLTAEFWNNMKQDKVTEQEFVNFMERRDINDISVMSRPELFTMPEASSVQEVIEEENEEDKSDEILKE
jgi:hypothetical protein